MDDSYSNLTEILTDGIILEKNLILLKNLNGLDRNELGGKEPVFIDVWPVSILDSDQILTDGHFDFDESSLFLLQLAGLLSRSAEWRKNSSLRIIIPIDGTSSQTDLFKRIKKSLDVFRIKAEIILARNDYLDLHLRKRKKKKYLWK